MAAGFCRKLRTLWARHGSGASEVGGKLCMSRWLSTSGVMRDGLDDLEVNGELPDKSTVQVRA
ncbi:hypothetical protein E4U55_007912 [Claviceps digitariae]|nr:hypothetical protein E4U55_007912 [Claviceps digitariae]